MIPYYVQHRYLLLLSASLPKFKASRRGVYNCRCPICGDSKTDSHKRRGYFFAHNDNLFYKCHNCGYSSSFYEFLKLINPTLHIEMVKECLSGSTPVPDLEEIEYHSSANMDRLKNKPACVLDGYHRIKDNGSKQSEYLKSRKITGSMASMFYEIPSIDGFAKLLPDFKDNDYTKAPAIGIPYYDANGLAYMQMRRIDNAQNRYTTFTVNGGKKIFGLRELDLEKRISILEGAFDAVFVDNAVATAGAQDVSNVQYLASLSPFPLRFIYDKDYTYNTDILRNVKARIREGHQVVLFDRHFPYKDINDAAIAGIPRIVINEYLDKRTFSGLKAQLELSKSA